MHACRNLVYIYPTGCMHVHVFRSIYITTVYRQNKIKLNLTVKRKGRGGGDRVAIILSM